MALRLRAIGVGVLSLVVVVAAFAAGSAQGTRAGAAGNNGLIAFIGSRGVFVMRADGSGVRLLLRLTAHGASDLAWAPDGRRLAFVTRDAAGTAIWVMDADGSDAVRLTARSRKASGDWVGLFSPTWSPDGRRIAYTYGVRGDRDVWVMNADGTSKRRLARTVGCKELDVDWSPQGDQFVTTCVWGWAARIVRLMKADGSAVSSLVGHKSPGSPYVWGPDWSPDGRRIAFARDKWKPREGGTYLGAEIYLVSAAGGSPVRLVPHGKKPMADRDPTWSPDGRRIAFARHSFGTGGAPSPQQPAGVYVMNADGTGVTRLTTCPGSSCWAHGPAWQPIG